MPTNDEHHQAVMEQVGLMLPTASTGDRRAAILTAAASVFLQEGYTDASMETIARTAGVAKQTVYAHFQNKNALFTTMLRTMCERVVNREALEEVMTMEPRQGLATFGRVFLGGILSAHAVAVFRVAVTESRRSPELGRMFYDAGPALVKQLLYRYLERLSGQGALEFDDVPLAGDMFLGMLIGPFHVEKVLGLSGPPTETEIHRIVDESVRIFVSIYRK